MTLKIFIDPECEGLFDNLGVLEVTEKRDVPFYLKNTGITRIVNISIESDYPHINFSSYKTKLDRNETTEGIIHWEVPHDTKEGTMVGTISIKGVSVGVME